VQRLFIEETGEEQPQQIDGDAGDGGLGGQVDAVEMVDAAHPGVRGQQLVGKLSYRDVHRGSIPQTGGKGKPNYWIRI